MKLKAIFIVSSSLSSGAGMYSGKVFFKFTPFAYKTIEEALEDNNVRILDDSETEAWLVLAQKYKENGTVTWQKERKQEWWTNPNFLSDYSESTEEKQLSEKLKTRCKEAKQEVYSFFLYRQVTQWCDFVLTDEAKQVLSFQTKESSKSCKFKLFKSKDDLYGLFIWEFLEDHSYSREDLISLNYALTVGKSYSANSASSESVQKWGSEIWNDCTCGKNVEIIKDDLVINDQNKGKQWRLKSKISK